MARSHARLRGMPWRMLWLWLTLGLSLCAAAQAQLPPPVAQALARAGIPQSAVSLYVQEVGTAEPLATHRAGQSMSPASVMKLVTTYSALELLGPAFTWNTDLYIDGTLQGGVLDGNVVIRGGGDPHFTMEDLWTLLRALRAKGVREIRGDLLLDRSLFTTDFPDPGLFDGEPTDLYNVTPDALLTNFKGFTLTLMPDAENRAVRAILDPPLPQVQVVNGLTLTEGPCGNWAGRVKIAVQDSGDTGQITLSGAYPRSCGEQLSYLSLLGHRDYVGALFSTLWRDMGGTFNGRVRDGEVAASAVRLATHRSPALAEIVRDINKYSNNVMARELLLMLGAGNGPATPARGARAVQQLLAAKNITMPELVIENGCGLSRIERVSARGLGQLLLTAYRGATMPEFMSSMPVVGVDGTMGRRLTNTGVAGQAHVKTGLINDVRALAGYMLDAHGRRVVLVLLINHPNAHYTAGPVQDAFLRWVYAR